jgi:hypothetical protein
LSKIAFLIAGRMEKTNYIACIVPLNADYIFGVLKKFLKGLSTHCPDSLAAPGQKNLPAASPPPPLS